MRPKEPETTFMLGASGFLGHYILRDMLAKGERVVAMIRPPLVDSSKRLCDMLHGVGVDTEACLASEQLVLVEGALPDKLPESTWGRTDAILNCAASLDLFANGNNEPFTTNVAGTEAIIDWAIQHDVIRIYAVSTAYTCGWKTGLIPEQYHTPAPEFQTDYERSKWKAELLLEEWAAWIGHSLTVFRPSFLVGDSETGRTTQFAGFYQFARLISDLKQRYLDPNNGELTHVPLRIPGHPHDRHNLVPVDFVSRIVAEVVARPEFHGRIYHLTNPEPPTNGMMKNCYEDYFKLTGGEFADPTEVIGHFTEAESLLWDRYHIVTPRMVHSPDFDTANTQEVMRAAGIPFPQLDRDRIRQLLDYAEELNWGRRVAVARTTA